jgi:hypothetical protein
MTYSLTDLVDQTERLRDAMVAEADARLKLVAMTREGQRNELPDAAVAVIEARARELLPDNRLTGQVSLHTLLSALGDLWRAGALHEARYRDGVL